MMWESIWLMLYMVIIHFIPIHNTLPVSTLGGSDIIVCKLVLELYIISFRVYTSVGHIESHFPYSYDKTVTLSPSAGSISLTAQCWDEIHPALHGQRRVWFTRLGLRTGWLACAYAAVKWSENGYCHFPKDFARMCLITLLWVTQSMWANLSILQLLVE